MFTKRNASLALAVVATVALAGAATAGAAKQVYPGGKGHTLNGGAGGWKAKDSQAGPLGETLCIVSGVLVCPTSTSAVAPDGGVKGAGDGFMQTEFGVTVGVAGSGTSVWKSKKFKYRGVKGKKAKKVKFRLKRQTDLTELLALPSSSATYKAKIVPAGKSGKAISLGSGDLPASSDWGKLPKQKVSKRALKKGKRYSIKITTTYETGVAGVAETGTVGYDNPKLVVKGKKRQKRK